LSEVFLAVGVVIVIVSLLSHYSQFGTAIASVDHVVIAQWRGL